jgi:4'-phosphopantetheinyl transferase
MAEDKTADVSAIAGSGEVGDCDSAGGRMQVHWLKQSLGEVRPDADWLCPAERARLETLRIPKRREDWRLGRWTAKRAAAAHLDLPDDPSALAAIEIRPAASGAPEVFIQNAPVPVSISLTHRDGRAVCAVAPAGTRLGCDLEVVEPRCDAFVSDYFTVREQELVAQACEAERFFFLAVLWSAKESTLKALREGLRIDVRDVEVSLDDDAGGALALHQTQDASSFSDEWQRLSTRFQQQLFFGWWQCAGRFVLTIISEAQLAPPVRMRMAYQIAAQKVRTSDRSAAEAASLF